MHEDPIGHGGAFELCEDLESNSRLTSRPTHVIPMAVGTMAQPLTLYDYE